MRHSFIIILLSALVLVACSGPSNRVLSVTPSPGATDVAVDAQIEATFRGSVEPHSLSEGFTLLADDGTTVSGEVTIGSDGRSAAFRPSSYLNYGKSYTAVIDAREARRGKGEPAKEFRFGWSFDTEADPVVVVEVNSHAEGEPINGPRSITLAGSLSSSAAVTDVTVRHNGAPLPDVQFFQTSFRVQVELNDNDDNLLEVLAENSAGKQGTAALTLDYPFTRLTTFQDAVVVIGQEDFTSNTQGRDQESFSTLRGNPTLLDGLLYLPDQESDRVMVYSGVPSMNGAPADSVLGQPDFATWSPGNGAGGLYQPGSVSGRGGRLAAADRGNNRVLIWNSAPSGNQAAAGVAVGQSGFDRSAAGCAADALRSPESALLVGGKLIVADSGNNRVLIWNSVPSSHGQPADLVLGQVGFETCAANDPGGTGSSATAPTGSTLNKPTDAWSDGRRLIVADSGNNRVLIWDTFPTTDFDPAAVVLGQERFDSRGAGRGAARLDTPTFLTSNGNQLFVADTRNNRVLIWDLIPGSNGAAADQVLGQSSFTCNIENVDPGGWCDYNWGGNLSPSSRTMYLPAGLHLLPEALIVADGYNGRYLVFDALAQP